MKKYLIVLSLFLIAGLVTAAQAQVKKASGIKDLDFGNFSYRAAFGETKEKTVKLTGGRFETDGGYDAGGSLYELFGPPAYGDVNGDRKDEAVVEIKLSAPSSYRAFEVYVFGFQNGAAKMLARIDNNRISKDYLKYYPNKDGIGPVQYAGVNPPSISSNGHIMIEALVEGSFACPAYNAVLDYKMTAAKLVLTGKPTRKAFKCNE